MNQFNRPKIHIPKTKLEWFADVIGYAALAFMVGLLLVSWADLPAEVPAHFGAGGEVDRWGSKFELLILPVISILLTIFMHVLEKFPQLHNYPARFNESNAQAFYTNSRQTLNYMKNIINMLFAYIVYNSIDITLGAAESIGWPLFALLALMFLVIGLNLVRMFKIK